MQVKHDGFGSRGRATTAFGMVRDRWHRRDDTGMTLIECVVAIALLVIVLVPTTLFVIEGQRAASQDHLEAEATTLADQALNGLQAEAARGNLPAGFQSTQQNVDEVGTRETVYTISTTWNAIVQGTNKSICAAKTGVSVAQQIWLVTASVTWPAMGGAAPVTATTEIAPGTAGGLQQSAGELAVTLDSGVGTSLFTGSSVTATMSAIWNNAANPTPPGIPSGESIDESQSSINTLNGKFDGCLVFQNLDVAVGWQYTLSFAGNGTITEAQEYSEDNPNGAYTFGPIILQAGVPQVMTVSLNTGTPISIQYTMGPGGNCTTAPGAPPPNMTTSDIPVTVNNTGLTYPNNDWIAYNASLPPFSVLYLYPSFSGVTNIWAGDGPNGEQASPCQVSPASLLPQTVYLQLYKLTLAVSGAGSSQLTATEIGGSDAAVYALSATGGGSTVTDLPLGHYTFTDHAGNNVTFGGAQASVWVTATGICDSAALTAPTPCNQATLTVAAP